MMASGDVYRVDNVAAVHEDDSSDDEIILDTQQKSEQLPKMSRPPPISTGGFDNSILDDDEFGEEGGEEVVISEFLQAERHVHFRDPKRSHNQTSSYPMQSLRTTAQQDDSNNNVDATPAFLRRAAKEMDDDDDARAIDPQPPNTLSMLRDNNNNNLNNMPDSSFYGADASALDGTFVSIRDLNYDDDVPSVDNERWNNSTFDRQSDISSGFPTETTTLLQQHQKRNRKNLRKQLPWQGGFFGSQVDKEDRKERRKMQQERGWFYGLMGKLRSKKIEMMNHPTGNDFTPRRQNGVNFHKPYYQPRSKLSFSNLLTFALCFHIGLCGIHDLFMRYLSYRNPDNDAEASWNGEGTYIPAYWFSVEGMIHNPLIGPGARTLTAFGALAPGLALSKRQVWRIFTALFESASCLQLALQVCILRMVVGDRVKGFERKRGTIFVAVLYLVSALIGTAWSMAIDPGRLITTSEMGTAGLLTGAIMQQFFTSDSKKDDGDTVDVEEDLHKYNNDNGPNTMATASNEQFTFQPVVPEKKRRIQFSVNSPFIMMMLQIILSWFSAYSSLLGTVTACGSSCALLLLVGVTRKNSNHDENNDLLFSESDVPPPPPPPTRFDEEGWNDDESTDTSVGAGKQVFHTPLMRRSILADDDEDEEPLGTRSSLRKRKGDNATKLTASHGLHGRSVRGKSLNAYQVLARLIGTLMATLLTLIPVVLISSSGAISNELTRAAVLGCKPMRIVYQGDNDEQSFECAGGCVPLSLTRVARKQESMKVGRCDVIAYRCWQQAGTMTLRNYEVEVGIYVVPNADGYCNNEIDANENYDDTQNEGEADENDGNAQQDEEE